MSIFWANFLLWCRKRWELLLGFFVGIFAILALVKRGPSKKIIEKKNKMNDEVSAAQQKASAELEKQHHQNLQTFLSRNDKIEEEAKEKLMSLEGAKKDRVKELLNSKDPESEIAAALFELLK